MNQETKEYNPFILRIFILAGLLILLSLIRHVLFGSSATTGYYLLEIFTFLLFILILFLTEKQYHQDKKQIADLKKSFSKEKEALTDQIEKLREAVAAVSNNNQERNQLETRQQQLIAQIREKAEQQLVSQGVLSAIAEAAHAMSAILYKELKPSGEFIVEATYGLPETFAPATFIAGEGLNGQVAVNGSPLVIEQIPDDYFQVASGLGSSKPNYLCFLPVMKENRCIALIELASFVNNNMDLLWPKVSTAIVEDELF